MLIAIILKWQK